MKQFRKTLLPLLLALLTIFSAAALFSCADEKEKTPEEIKIYTLNGTTGFGMAKLIADAADDEDSLYDFTVQSDASAVSQALLTGDADIATLPTNAAANLYQKSGGKVKLLAINTLGCLYLLTGEGASVTSFNDLRGKTVCVPAQNPTFIFTYLCEQNGLTVGEDVTIDSTSYAQAANLRDAVAGGLVEIAVLPEPMVTIAVSQAKKNGTANLTVAMDLTVEWDKVCSTPLVQGCAVVRAEFLEEYPEAVEEFLKQYKASIEFLNEKPTEAAQMIADAEIFANATVAEKAIPNCNVAYLDGKEMRDAMDAYLAVLFEIAPASIGGKLPDDGFYDLH